MIPHNAQVEEPAIRELQRQYELRFRESQEYRRRVWKILIRDFFQPLIPSSSHVLDLGCGWGEFINQIDAALKYGMDLNPESRQKLAPNVHFIEQDCSARWPLGDRSLDVVFSSNFFEHLRAKSDLRQTLGQVHRCLKPGGRLICMGPNIKCLPGMYWDFWDHYLPLTEQSLKEVLELVGFKVERCIAKFLPYRMVGRKPAPLTLVRLYLKFPWVWRFFGRQFLIIARA
jgi:SAM-dependent methyltransferase